MDGSVAVRPSHATRKGLRWYLLPGPDVSAGPMLPWRRSVNTDPRSSACPNTLKALIPSFDRGLSVLPSLQNSSFCVTDADASMSGCTNFAGGHLTQWFLRDSSFGNAQLCLHHRMLFQAPQIYFQPHVEGTTSLVVNTLKPNDSLAWR